MILKNDTAFKPKDNFKISWCILNDNMEQNFARYKFLIHLFITLYSISIISRNNASMAFWWFWLDQIGQRSVPSKGTDYPIVDMHHDVYI